MKEPRVLAAQYWAQICFHDRIILRKISRGGESGKTKIVLKRHIQHRHLNIGAVFGEPSSGVFTQSRIDCRSIVYFGVLKHV